MTVMPLKAGEQPQPGSQSSTPLSPRAHMRPTSPDPRQPKRPRLEYGNANTINSSCTPMTAGDSSAVTRTPESAVSSVSWQQTELPRIHEGILMRTWQTDPYVNDPQSATTVVASFFARIDCTALSFLPQKPFMSWAESSAHRKSPEDQMLIYSILAVGLILSDSEPLAIQPASLLPTGAGAVATDGAAAGSSLPLTLNHAPYASGDRALAFEYSQVARYASERVPLSIQLVQSRLLLSIYYLALSRRSDSNDMLSAAISTAMCLQLNMELQGMPEADGVIYPYNFNRAGYEEMRRRTFWSCFILERLNGLFPTRPAIINIEDIFLRLPAPLVHFEDLSHLQAPLFDSSLSSTSGAQQLAEIDCMAHLVRVTAIWGDVMANIQRLAHRDSTLPFDFHSFHHQNMTKLAAWLRSLGSRFTFSRLNLEYALGEANIGKFATMHLLYHLASLKLNRHIHRRILGNDPTGAKRLEYQSHAREHAKGVLDVLDLVKRVAAQRPEVPLPPLCSYALLEAVDVLAAGGQISEIPALLDAFSSSREVQALLGNTWEEAAVQTKATYQRIMLLSRIRNHAQVPPSSPIDGCRILAVTSSTSMDEKPTPHTKNSLSWQLSEPMDLRFPREMDAMYSDHWAEHTDR